MIVEARGVEVWYADAPPVLGPLDLSIRVGEHWALLGPNGCGKSTLLSLIGAQRFPSRGRVVVLDSEIGRVDLRALRRRIGSVDAAARIPTWLTVTAYVTTGLTQTVQPLWNGDRPPPAEAERAIRAIELVGLEGFEERTVATLSAGERARARIARALVNDPPLLLLDEPAAGLDLPGRADLLAALERIERERPVTTVTVAHHLEELPATTTHVALLRREPGGGPGRLVAAGGVELLGDTALLGETFGRSLVTTRLGGRWIAVATPP